MAENADNCENHAREVAVGIADKDLGGVPVVPEEGAGDADPGEEEVEGEEVRVRGRVRIRGEEVEAVVEGQEAGDDDALRNLDAVDAGKHVDALRAEHGDAGHVDVVKGAQVKQLPQPGLELGGDDDGGDIKVDEVDDEERDGGETGNPPLVAPANVEEVIANSEQGNSLEGDDGAEVRRELEGMSSV